VFIKDIVNSIEITEEDHRYFVSICSGWALYCDAISNMDRYRVIKLMKYLSTERPYSKRLLLRAISRFNRLNILRREALSDNTIERDTGTGKEAGKDKS